MRQLSPITNLLLACLAAVGLLASLGLPWYAPARETTPHMGAMEQYAQRLARTFTSEGTTLTGGHAIAPTGRTLLLIVAAVVIVTSLAMIVPALRASFRDLLRAVSLVAPLTVVYLAFDTPGAAAALEIRWGLIIGVATAALMATSAWHGAGARLRRPAPKPAHSRAAA